MRKVFVMFSALFLIAGTVTFAQEEEFVWGWQNNGISGVGFQMNFTRIDDADWVSSPTLALKGRYYLLPLGNNLELGFAFSGSMAFRSEMEWTSPEDGSVKKISNDDANYIFDFGVLLGPSLQGKIAGPLGFVVDAGININFMTATFRKAYLSLLYGYVDLEYTTIDLGAAMNGGLQINFKQFAIEAGINVGYSFFKRNSWHYIPENDVNNILATDDITENIPTVRVCPYIMLCVRF